MYIKVMAFNQLGGSIFILRIIVGLYCICGNAHYSWYNKASVHIYTVTYRVTYRRVCTYYIIGHYRDTTWMHACLFNELTHKLTGCFGVNYSDVLVTFFVTEWLF